MKNWGGLTGERTEKMSRPHAADDCSESPDVGRVLALFLSEGERTTPSERHEREGDND